MTTRKKKPASCINLRGAETCRPWTEESDQRILGIARIIGEQMARELFDNIKRQDTPS